MPSLPPQQPEISNQIKCLLTVKHTSGVNNTESLSIMALQGSHNFFVCVCLNHSKIFFKGAKRKHKSNLL
jgi:hypothetical protein